MTRRPPLVLIKPDRSIPQPIRQPAENPTYTPKEKASPLTLAQRWLGDRLEDRGEMGYYLDGQPADLTRVMRATNRVLKSNGQEPITVNPAWACD